MDTQAEQVHSFFIILQNRIIFVLFVVKNPKGVGAAGFVSGQ